MFLNPLMLAGLGGALLPLVLHLLGRARHRSVDWGAMMFLDGADPRDQQSSRLKQYALLALRMLIVALLAMTLSRPVTNGYWATLGSGGPANVVLLLDCSASMATVDGGRSRMEAAREVALRLLGALQPGDRVALVLAGQGLAEDGSGGGPAALSSDLHTTAGRIAAARPGDGRIDLAQELSQARALLDHHAAGQDARIFIVCDRQAVSWEGVTPEFARLFVRSWQQDRGGAGDAAGRVMIFPVGSDLADNLLVESLRLVNVPAIVGEAADVEVRVRNTGNTAQPAVPLSLYEGGLEVGSQRVAVAPKASATARFNMRFGERGTQLVEARITSTGLTSDDALSAAVDVRAPLRVLIVSGDERGEEVTAAESFFFRTAAAPYAAAGHAEGVDPAIVTVVTAEAFDLATLGKFDVLVLANVGQLTPAVVRAVEQFTYEGGGLLIAPGGLVDPTQYNHALWRDGTGILPAQLLPATSVGGGEATSILGIDLDHPTMAFLRGRPDPIPSVLVGRYFPAVPRQPDAAVVGTYASGRPFLVEARWGRGRVVLLTTPIDTDWSGLPLSGFYVPFVQSTLRHLAGNNAQRNVRPGTPIVAALPDEAVSEVVLELPDGRRVEPAIQRSGTRAEAYFDRTTGAGHYTLRYRTSDGAQSAHFVVQPSRDDADLSPLPPDRWDEIVTTLGAQRMDVDAPQLLPAVASPSGQGRELWGTLLAMTLATILVETALSRRWSVGAVR